MTIIGQYALSAVSMETEVTSVAIPNPVVTIGREAFWGSSLRSVSIPDSVAMIDDGAFSENLSLSAVRLGKGVVYIGSRAEEYCRENGINYVYASSGDWDDDPVSNSVAGKSLSLSVASYNRNGRHGVQLKWNDLGEGVTYTVYRKWAKADKPYTRITATAGSVFLNALTDHYSGYVYYYYVKAEDDFGNSIKSKTQRIQFAYKK